MTDMIWQDPPPPGNPGGVRSGRTQRFVDELHARPGVWALYPHPAASSAVVSVNARRFPGTEWTGRKRPDGKRDLYARSIRTVDGES